PEREPSSARAVPADPLSGQDVAGVIVTGGLQRVGGFVVINLLTAAAAVLLLRYLGVRDFGRYGTVLALMTIVQGISDGGLTLTGARELSLRTDEAERKELLGNLVGLRMLLTGAGVLAAVAFAMAVGYSGTLVAGTALVGLSVFALSVQSALLLPLTVELKNSRLAVNDVLRQSALVATLLLLAVLGASLIPFFAASPIAAGVVLLATPAVLGRHRLVAPRWAAPALRSLAITTLPLALFGVLSVLYFRVLVILMSLLQTSALQLGYYVTSARVIEIFLGIPVVLIGVVLPVLSVSARDDMARLQFVTLRLTQSLAWLGMLFAVILGTGARPILMLFGGAEYLGAARVLQIQCIALVTVFVTAAWTTPLVGMGRARDLAIATAVGLAGVVTAGSILISTDAADGAAVAAVLADLVYCATVFVYARRGRVTQAVRLRTFAPIVISALPAVGLALTAPLPAALDCVIATALFIVLSLRLGAVPPEITGRVRAVLPRGHSAGASDLDEP
ncbi:MAG: hypothetical protein ABI355_19045, partial [Solirubrobacteraceae bacterium]